MGLTPDYSRMTKFTTTSQPALDLVTVELQFDNDYRVGGYPITSQLLFGEPGWNFRLVGGYVFNPMVMPLGFWYMLAHDVVNSKLLAINTVKGHEEDDHTGMVNNRAFATFIRW
jgi:hypothetical protein